MIDQNEINLSNGHLSAKGFRIGDEGAMDIAAALENNSSLIGIEYVTLFSRLMCRAHCAICCSQV